MKLGQPSVTKSRLLRVRVRQFESLNTSKLESFFTISQDMPSQA